MGVARQIGEHGLWSAERGLGVEVPFDLAQRREIRREGLALGERGVIAEELELAGLVGRHQLVQEQTPEQAGEDPHG